MTTVNCGATCNASIAFNIAIPKNEPGVRHLLKETPLPLPQCIYECGPYCDLIPADVGLADLQRNCFKAQKDEHDSESD